MRGREAAGSSSIVSILRGAYKGIGFQLSELKTQVRNDSWGLVVFENGQSREVTA